MVSANPQVIMGDRISGIALDIHTIKSIHLGVDEHGRDIFETVRSELGQLLFQLKYRGDQTAVPEIIATAKLFLDVFPYQFDRIVPVPPTTPRTVQPVILLAEGIGKALGVPVINCITETRPSSPLKNIYDPRVRRGLLAGLYDVEPIHVEAHRILLFDDVFRSGATMDAITEVLLEKGRATCVMGFAITRTSSTVPDKRSLMWLKWLKRWQFGRVRRPSGSHAVGQPRSGRNSGIRKPFATSTSVNLGQ